MRPLLKKLNGKRDLKWVAGTLMLDHRPQLEVEFEEECQENDSQLEVEEECQKDDSGNVYDDDEAHEDDQIKQPCQKETPAVADEVPAAAVPERLLSLSRTLKGTRPLSAALCVFALYTAIGLPPRLLQ
eukprot:5089479-Amphidinium_carterae.1